MANRVTSISRVTGRNKKVKQKRSSTPAKKQTVVAPTPQQLEAMQLRRILLIGTVLFACMSGVGASCIYLQGCESDAFVQEAERNYLRKLSLDTQRGDIFDRNGEALAISVEVDTVYANPRKVTDPIGVAAELAEILEMDEEQLIYRLTSSSHFRYLKRQVTQTEADKVRERDFDGIMISRESKRFYPKKELAGQVLGVVGFDSRGQEGLESTWDTRLRGGQLEARYHRDSRGRYAMVDSLPPVETKAGHSLQITVDEKIQGVVERELERACLSSLARGGIAVVMDVETGDILAVGHYPRFNPNRYREQIAEDRALQESGKRVVQRFKNRSITDIYEPGSTFKIFTVAAGLEEGVVGLEDMVDLEGGRYKVGRKWISDTHRFKERKKSVSDIIKYSSNVGVIKIGQMLGRERLHTYLSDFGFGSTSGVGLGGDSPGILRPHREWAEITLANVAFGQGVAVTAIQITAATAAIGNDGVLMQPRLVMAEMDSDGNVLQRFDPRAVRRVVSVATARQVRKAMTGVVEPDGTGHAAWLYDYDVAGKTGTAQKADTLAGGYAEDRWVASFIGLVPARKPKLSILVAIDEPHGMYYGGVVAAPAFKAIADWTLNYLAVPPDYGSRERVIAAAVVSAHQPPIAAEGAYYDWPADRQPGVNPQQPRSVAVPDFSDMAIRGAVKRAHDSWLVADVDGTGLAAGQSVAPGTQVHPWTRVTIYFRPGDLFRAPQSSQGGQ